MTDQPAEDRVLVEVTVPAPADAVWAALRDKDRILQWFGWDADSLSDEVDFIFFQHASADDARRVLTFEGVPDRYEVEDRGDHAVIRVVRSAPVSDSDWSAVYEDMTEGWITFTQQLAFMLTRHMGETRRTLYLSGEPAAENALNGPAALGFDAVPAAGEPWAGPVGPEAALAGEVWHLGRHQTGLTVAQWGDGLLVVHNRAPGDSHPRGWTSATLTTYGLDDAAFATLEARWTDWWAARFDKRAPGS